MIPGIKDYQLIKKKKKWKIQYCKSTLEIRECILVLVVKGIRLVFGRGESVYITRGKVTQYSLFAIIKNQVTLKSNFFANP